jgi:ubiquinone/menaquinone biosynthesis C-methylase UbiE
MRFFTGGHYIMGFDNPSFTMPIFRRGLGPHALATSMAGVKMGDRLLQMGAGDGTLFAALASKVGLTGRACLVDRDPHAIERSQHAAAKAGVLIETELMTPGVPYGDHSFDLVVVHRILSSLAPAERLASLAEALRVLRGGGRCLVIESAPRGGLLAALSGARADSAYLHDNGPEKSLQAQGFKASRKLAEREGTVFYEGVRGNE